MTFLKGRTLQCHLFAETGPTVRHRFIELPSPSLEASENEKSSFTDATEEGWQVVASWEGAVAQHSARQPRGSCTTPPLSKKSRARRGRCCSRGQSSTSEHTGFSSACLLPPPPVPHTPPSLLLLLKERHFLTLPHGLPALLSHVSIKKKSFSYFQFLISFPQEHYSITAGRWGGIFSPNPISAFPF